MSGREVREYTNLSDPKDKKWGKGKDRVDDEDVTFQRMVAKVRDLVLHGLVDAIRCRRLLENGEGIFMDEGVPVSLVLERDIFPHKFVKIILSSAALDSDDLLYLKEQMEAEEDAERLLRRTEKRAFAAFKRAANLADSTPASLPLPLRVEPKTKSGIRQQDFLKKIVEVKPKKQRASSPSQHREGCPSNPLLAQVSLPAKTEHCTGELKASGAVQNSFVPIQASSPETTEQGSTAGQQVADSDIENPVKSLLGIVYESSDED